MEQINDLTSQINLTKEKLESLNEEKKDLEQKKINSQKLRKR